MVAASPSPRAQVCRPGGSAANENCDPLDWQRGAPGLAKAAAAGPLGRQHGAAALAALAAGDAACQLQSCVDAELEAAARDTMLAQCHALLSLDDPECLPHDPLFDLLPPPGLAAAARRCLPKPHQVAAALAAAAEEAVALGRTIGAGMMDESTMAATLLPASMVPGTCCRNKRSADAPAPATQLAVPPQRRQQLEGGECGTVAAAAGVATPGTATPLQMPGLAMAGKRQRMLLLTAARGAAQGATPGSGVGSNSRVQPRAARRVARDLSFTPAPPQRQPEPGSPPTAGSASRCSGTRPASPAKGSTFLQPFSLLRRPSTSAQIQELNARIAASAAADIRYERCRRPAAPAPGADCAGSAAAPATRSVRLH